jgi:hypothetical protein
MNRVIDFIGTALHPQIAARTHCLRFVDMVHGAEAFIFLDEQDRLMLRRLGNLYSWPPLNDWHAGAMMYALGELVEHDGKGNPTARPRGRFESAFQILHCGVEPVYLGNMSLREAGARFTQVAYRCPACLQEFLLVDQINLNTPEGQAAINVLHDAVE